MHLHKRITLSGPLKGVAVAPPRVAPTFDEEQYGEAKRAAYQKGFEEATRAMEHQLLEQRGEMVHLQNETFEGLSRQHAALSEQLQGMLPELTMEAIRRILAGTAIDRETVLGIAKDLLAEIAPGQEQIEVRLAPGDLELIAGYEEGFREKHPQIVFRADPELKAGDCVVRSRFGDIDGRLSTKMRTIETFLK